MRKTTVRTVLNPLFRIAEIAAALLPQDIERAEAKETVEFLSVHSRMTGKIFTGCVLEKLMAHTFSSAPWGNKCIHRAEKPSAMAER